MMLMVLMDTHFKFRFEEPYERPLLPEEMNWDTYILSLECPTTLLKEVSYQRVRGDLTIRELRALPDPLQHKVVGSELVLTYKLSKSQVAALAKNIHTLGIGCPFLPSPVLLSDILSRYSFQDHRHLLCSMLHKHDLPSME